MNFLKKLFGLSQESETSHNNNSPLPVEWINIPAGSTTIEDGTRKGSVLPEGTKGGQYDVPAFMIAKYPVTVAEYEVFVNDGGYGNSDYWYGQSPTSAYLEFWNNPEWHKPNHPVVGVSWYEAIAFCTWLSNKKGKSVLLPTEQQWQRAAQGDDGRKYPWGDECSKEYANYGQKAKDGRTTPVTQYPNGASPYGVMDMSGNVDEWCLTEWGTDSTELKFESVSERVLRGGGWNASEGTITTTYRSSNNSHYGSYFWGFRICISTP